jgi:hypothetical protein
MASCGWRGCAGADLRQLDWTRVPVLGDEVAARRARDDEGQLLTRAARITATVDAVRVYRQLAIAVDDLPAEPALNVTLNKVAVNYNFRAQVLQRCVYWLRRDYGR